MNHTRSATALAALLVLATAAAAGVVATTDASTAIGGQLDAAAGDSTTLDQSLAPDSPDFAPNHTATDRLERLLDEFDLTENETDAIVDELSQMHEDDASRADVHHALHYRLYQHGYDTAAVHAEIASARLEVRVGLDDARADELGTEVVELRRDGASGPEIREHVRDRLDDWGIDVDGDRDGHARLDRALDHLQGRYDLTDDEVDELRDLAIEMHEDGATRGEIKHALVHEAQDLDGSPDDDGDADADATVAIQAIAR